MRYLIPAAALAILVALAWYTRRTARPTYDEVWPLDSILVPVDDPGDWTAEALAEVRDPGHPLERQLSDIELAEPLLFDEISAAYPVRLDWAPPGFTQGWDALGDLAAQLGDTQTFEAVPA